MLLATSYAQATYLIETWQTSSCSCPNCIAWCTGAGQGYILEAADLGVDGFLSGEISEQTAHQARELGVDYFAAGHDATERYGVQALAAHLAERFELEHRFLDLDNPA
jgi:putative NIF3 family GTP cyclohydrolase 1 type 2